MTTAADAAAPTGGAIIRTRGFGWFLTRAIFGIAVMLMVTSIAAFIAHASIDAPEIVDEITIGVAAAPLLARADQNGPTAAASVDR